MNSKLVFHILGLILRVEAVLMLPSAAIGFACGTGDGPDFLISAAITLLVGQLLTLLPRKGAKMQARDGFATVGLGWIVLSLFGALPYVFSGVIPNYIDAVFETVSGFTTTGATVLTVIEGLPTGVLFWRAQTQWMGGVGVLVLALALIPKLGEGSVYLMRAESPGPIKSKLTPRLGDTAKILYIIYIGLTVAETVCLRLAGMSWYEVPLIRFLLVGHQKSGLQVGHNRVVECRTIGDCYIGHFGSGEGLERNDGTFPPMLQDGEVEPSPIEPGLAFENLLLPGINAVEFADGFQGCVGPADPGIGVVPQPVQKIGTAVEARHVLELIDPVIENRAAAVGKGTAPQRIVRAEVSYPRTDGFPRASFAIGCIDAVGQTRDRTAVFQKIVFCHLTLSRLVEKIIHAGV